MFNQKIIKTFLIGKNICEGHKTWTDWGYEYDCGYGSGCLCEDCIFSHGFFLPWKSENSFFNKIIAPIFIKIFTKENEMFKYKVSVYMKSGNIMHLKCKSFNFADEINTFRGVNCYLYKIEKSEMEGYIVKKWWQRWG